MAMMTDQNSTEVALTSKCGRTKTNRKHPFTAESLASHEKDCPDCRLASLPVDDDVPKRGWWYEIIDFSDRDYGSDWGYYLYKDGERVYSSGGLWSRISQAGDEAREHKARAVKSGKI